MRSLLLTGTVLLLVHAHAINVTLTAHPATCGECNGAATAAVSGGAGAYSYTWYPAPAGGQGTATVGGLCPGTWTVVVYDSDGNTATDFITVPAFPGLDVAGALAASMVYAACPGQCNGQLLLNESLLGGMPPYSTSTFPVMPLNALCGNTPFDLTVSDANGCTGAITTVVPERAIPHLLYTEVNGPCASMPTSVVAHFDMLPDVFSVTPPGGSPLPYSIIDGGIALTAATPGVYTITEPSIPPCPNNSWVITYPATVTDCASVNGDVFVDITGDCILNGNDFGLANRLVQIEPGGYTTLTNALGHYQRQLPDGTYDLSVTDPVYSQDCPVASPVNFTVNQVTPATIDLAFTPGPDPDVSVNCAFDAAVVGFGQNVWITVTNNSGVFSGSLAITLNHDPTLTYCQAWACVAPPFGSPLVLPYPTSFIPGQLTWNLGSGLAPGQSRVLSARLCVPPDITLLGTSLDYTATANTSLNDADPSNNICTHTETVVGSYDPNDKQARTSSGSADEWSVANDSLITYTIRFQNTGSAPAVNVVLVDTLQTTLDLSSLKVLGASHTHSTALNGRVLTFTFDHIMLPASNSNEAGSHGFAQFSIKPVSMSPGSSVENFADIYFDVNPPVRTNTSTVSAPLTTLVGTVQPVQMVLHPNPASVQLILDLPPGPHTVTLLNALGKQVMEKHTREQHPVIDIAGLPPGIYLLRMDNGPGIRWVKE